MDNYGARLRRALIMGEEHVETRYWLARLRKLVEDLEHLAVIESSRAQDAQGTGMTSLHDGKSLAFQETRRLVLDVLTDLVHRSRPL